MSCNLKYNWWNPAPTLKYSKFHVKTGSWNYESLPVSFEMLNAQGLHNNNYTSNCIFDLSIRVIQKSITYFEKQVNWVAISELKMVK